MGSELVIGQRKRGCVNSCYGGFLAKDGFKYDGFNMILTKGDHYRNTVDVIASTWLCFQEEHFYAIGVSCLIIIIMLLGCLV